MKVHGFDTGGGEGPVPSGIEFSLLGPLEVRRGGTEVTVPRGKQRAVLAALLLDRGRVISLDGLAEVLWGARPPASARVTVQNYVKRLRHALGDSDHTMIGTQQDGYVISADGGLDVCRFEALMSAARAAAGQGDWATAAQQARAALSLWRGEALAGVESELLVLREVPRLAELRLQAVEVRIEADLHLGDHTGVIAELQRLSAAHPLRERLHAMLMLAFYRDGRQSEALAVYQRARRLLIDEVGMEPGAELQEMHQAILTADVAALGGAGPAPLTEAGRNATVLRQLPAAVRSFSGREAELKALTCLLDEAARPQDSPGTAVIAVIGGPAGVGKTALALHWAHQAAGRFPDGQLYLDLRGYGPTGAPMTPAEAVRKCLDALGVPAVQLPVDPDAQAGLYRGMIAGKRMLIVLDNAGDAGQVRPLLPASPASLVIVTSRSQLAGLVASDGASSLILDVLSHDEARQLLARRLGADRVAADQAAADELIKLCVNLPLALTVAAARAAIRPGFPLAALTAELRDSDGRLDALDAGDPATNVRAVFSWSYRSLTPGAARMFRLLGCHPGADISVLAMASLARLSPAKTRALLVELARVSLITEHVPGRFACHDLLRAYAAEQVCATESPACQEQAMRRLLDHYLHTAHSAASLLYPGRGTLRLGTACPGTVPVPLQGYRQAWAWLDTECAALLALAEFAYGAGFDTHAWQIPWTLTEFLDRRGRWHDWTASQRTALAAAGRLGDSGAQGRVHRDLGLAYAKLGQHDNACTHLQRALGYHQQDGDQCGMARAHYALSQVYELSGDRRRALAEAGQALALYREAGHAAGEARALNSVGWSHALLGEYRQAVTFCEQAIVKLRDVGDLAGEADTWDSLGYAHQHLGSHAEALACYARALNPYRDLGDRRSQARSLTHVGDTHHAAGSPRAARAAWRQALAILDELNLPGSAGQVRARLGHLAV